MFDYRILAYNKVGATNCGNSRLCDCFCLFFYKSKGLLVLFCKKTFFCNVFFNRFQKTWARCTVKWFSSTALFTVTPTLAMCWFESVKKARRPRSSYSIMAFIRLEILKRHKAHITEKCFNFVVHFSCADWGLGVKRFISKHTYVHCGTHVKICCCRTHLHTGRGTDRRIYWSPNRLKAFWLKTPLMCSLAECGVLCSNWTQPLCALKTRNAQMLLNWQHSLTRICYKKKKEACNQNLFLENRSDHCVSLCLIVCLILNLSVRIPVRTVCLLPVCHD